MADWLYKIKSCRHVGAHSVHLEATTIFRTIHSVTIPCHVFNPWPFFLLVYFIHIWARYFINWLSKLVHLEKNTRMVGFEASHVHRTLSRGTGSWDEQLAVASWLVSAEAAGQVFPRRAELVWGWVRLSSHTPLPSMPCVCCMVSVFAPADAA